MSVLLDALRKAAKDNKSFNTGKDDHIGDTFLTDSDENKEPDSLNNSKKSGYDSNGKELIDDDYLHGEQIGIKSGPESDACIISDDGFDPELNDEDFKEEGTVSGDRLISERLSSAKKIEFSFGGLSSSNHYKTFLFILLFPILFFIIIFYSAVQWYSGLDKQFDAKMRNLDLNSVFALYNHYGISDKLKSVRTSDKTDDNGTKTEGLNARDEILDGSGNAPATETIYSHSDEPISRSALNLGKQIQPERPDSSDKQLTSSGNSIVDNAGTLNKKVLNADDHLIIKSIEDGGDQQVQSILNLVQDGKFQEALNHIEQYERNSTPDPNMLKLKIFIVRNVLGDREAALLIEKVLSNNFVDKGLALLYTQLDDSCVKPEVLDQFISYFPDEPLLYLKLSRAYLRVDPLVSIQILEEASTQVPDYYIFYNLAQLYKLEGDTINFQKNMAKALLILSREKEGKSDG